MAADGMHPLRVQLRHRGAPWRRTGSTSSASAATRPIRPRRATRARRRCGSTTTRTVEASACCTRCGGGPTARSRRSTGTRRSARWPPASVRCATPTAARRSSTTAVAARGTTSAARTRRPRSTRSAPASGRAPSPRRRPARCSVNGHMLGTPVRGEFDHCEVALFVGKNPWMSHGIPHARTTLKAIANDPDRSMVVIDPRRTETAELADFHLQVRPGRDAWLLGAMAAVLSTRACSTARGWRSGRPAWTRSRPRCGDIPIAEWCAISGVAEDQVRAATRRLAAASSVAVFEDLGVQMNRHSTLVSYLEKLVWLLTGNLGKPGTQYSPTSIANLVRTSRKELDRERGPAHQRARRAGDRRADPVQRDRRRDPRRSPDALPGDDRRVRQPGPLARRQRPHARGASGASTCSCASTCS